MDYSKAYKKLNRIRGHVLFPQKILDSLPDFYKTEGEGYDAKAHIKIFHPLSSWYWYVSEYDGADIFYGLVIGHEVEFGYFNRSEMELGVVGGLPFERDIGFEPISFRELIKQLRKDDPHRRYPDLS